MTASDILAGLIQIQPAFRAHWNGTNLFVSDDGSFTACGVFSQFTTYFCAHHLEMKKEEIKALSALVSRCEEDQALGEAAYTCFLENIAGDPPEKTIAPFLSKEAAEFIAHWKSRA